MKRKSNKLAKLERNRFSIFTDDLEHCYYCGARKDDLHEIFGGIRRRRSMEFGLVLPLCRNCHTRIEHNEEIKLKMKQNAERRWIEENKPLDEKDFILFFGKNYI